MYFPTTVNSLSPTQLGSNSKHWERMETWWIRVQSQEISLTLDISHISYLGYLQVMSTSAQETTNLGVPVTLHQFCRATHGIQEGPIYTSIIVLFSIIQHSNSQMEDEKHNIKGKGTELSCHFQELHHPRTPIFTNSEDPQNLWLKFLVKLHYVGTID